MILTHRNHETTAHYDLRDSMSNVADAAQQILRILSDETESNQLAFQLFAANDHTKISTALCDAFLIAAVNEAEIGEDEADESKEFLLAGTELDLKFNGRSQNVEACKYQAGETTWAGCEVLEHATEFTVTIPQADPDALAALCACLNHRFWNSSAPVDFEEESLNPTGSEFLFLDQNGKRCSGQPESEDGISLEPEYSGDGDSVYFAQNFGSDIEYEPWDSIPTVASNVSCIWILALLAKVKWEDLDRFDVRGHEVELEQLIKDAFDYFSE